MKEKTKKPRYRMGQNMLWMLRQAHAAHRVNRTILFGQHKKPPV